MEGLSQSQALMLEAAGHPVQPAHEVVDLPPEELRIFEVYKLMLEGMRLPHSVWEWSRKQGWGVSLATIAGYMKQAIRDAHKCRPRNLAMERTRAIDQLAMLYERCVANSDYRGALAMRAEMNKLLGLYPKEGSQAPIGAAIVFQTEVVPSRSLGDFKQIIEHKPEAKDANG